MAAVFCASFSRRAMVLRSRVIFTRSSPSLGARGRPWRRAAAAARRPGGRGSPARRPWRSGRPWRCRRRPARRVTPFSAIILAAAGSGACAVGRPPGRRRGPAAGARRLDLRLARRRRGAGAGGGAAARAAAGLARGGRRRPAPMRAEHARRPRPRRPRRRRSLSMHAGGGGVHLHRDLVGLELDQRLVRRHRLAGLLQPAGHGRRGDALAQGGHQDLGRHRLSAFSGAGAAQARAPGRTSASCCCCVHLGEPGRRARRLLAADIVRPLGLDVERLSTFSIRRSTKVQAPMFSGSSWHQTTSALR